MKDLTDITAMALDRIYAAFEKPKHLAPCDLCGERPGDRIATEARISVCDECDEAELAKMQGRKVLQFRTRDDRDAYEAGSRTRGEI